MTPNKDAMEKALQDVARETVDFGTIDPHKAEAGQAVIAEAMRGMHQSKQRG